LIQLKIEFLLILRYLEEKGVNEIGDLIP